MSNQIKVSGAVVLQRGGQDGDQAAPKFWMYVQNGSGGSLAAGDVVVWKVASCTADVMHVTTTTGANDLDVAGMMLETVADAKIGRMQFWGPTRLLKVDGTTDIAAGDYLGTFTTAKIAAKTTTTGAFALALEAYSTNDSSGVIDAFLMAGFTLRKAA